MSRLPERYPDGPGFKACGPSEQAATCIAPTAAAMRSTVLQVYASTYSPGLDSRRGCDGIKSIRPQREAARFGTTPHRLACRYRVAPEKRKRHDCDCLAVRPTADTNPPMKRDRLIQGKATTESGRLGSG